ncbi:MAG: PHP domain-containing protein [Deltaproteobacteria bacterium]|nr:PHP domain-containing protein [Deltaproteobacteria bacterium]
MIIALHCHSKFSQDNYLEPRDLIARAVELGLDGVCFTERHSLNASLPVTMLRVLPPFAVFRRVEISTDHGHVPVHGLEDDGWNIWGGNNHLKLNKVLERGHALGGICLPAHPFRGWESIGEKVCSVKGVAALETHNGGNLPHQNSPAIEAALRLSLPSVGGSDCHRPEDVGRSVTEFSDQIRSMNDLVGEIKAGNCRGLMLG